MEGGSSVKFVVVFLKQSRMLKSERVSASCKNIIQHQSRLIRNSYQCVANVVCFYLIKIAKITAESGLLFDCLNSDELLSSYTGVFGLCCLVSFIRYSCFLLPVLPICAWFNLGEGVTLRQWTAPTAVLLLENPFSQFSLECVVIIRQYVHVTYFICFPAA